MAEENEPKLVRRRANKKSTLKQGRTMSGGTEKLESSSERLREREKKQKKQRRRVVRVLFGFLVIFGVMGMIGFQAYRYFAGDEKIDENREEELTVEVEDEDGNVGGEMTEKMKKFINLAVAEFQDKGFTVEKAVIPTGKVREVDFYLQGRGCYIKMNIDRGAAVSVEDASRMIKYLDSEGVVPEEYIDVRVERKGFYR